jgi:hypothetical protein
MALNPDYVPANIQEPATWTYDIDPATGASRASYPGEVVIAGNPVGGPTTGTGALVLQNSPALTGNPTAPTPAVGDSDQSIATTAFVQSALRYNNYADNSGFALNQRSYASGTALAAAAFGHDRWKAGAGGCTYTFAQSAGPSTLITITAGTLLQVVEGASLAAGNYTLSWTGSAQGRVGAGSFAASPVAVAGVVAGTNTTIEFNTGTLGQVKLEAGTLATTWIAPRAGDNLANCQRFYYVSQILSGGYAVASTPCIAPYGLPVVMRATPTLAITNFASSVNISGVAITPVSAPASNRDLFASGTCVATGTYQINFQFTASADL